MTRSLAVELRELVAEDLAGPGGAGLAGDHRREFARQRIFAHLDLLTQQETARWSGRPEEGQSSGTRGPYEYRALESATRALPADPME